MKLGFIAMSGVRAHNPELTALGLTLPGFVKEYRKLGTRALRGPGLGTTANRDGILQRSRRNVMIFLGRPVAVVPYGSIRRVGWTGPPGRCP